MYLYQPSIPLGFTTVNNINGTTSIMITTITDVTATVLATTMPATPRSTVSGTCKQHSY